MCFCDIVDFALYHTSNMQHLNRIDPATGSTSFHLFLSAGPSLPGQSSHLMLMCPLHPDSKEFSANSVKAIIRPCEDSSSPLVTAVLCLIAQTTFPTLITVDRPEKKWHHLSSQEWLLTLHNKKTGRFCLDTKRFLITTHTLNRLAINFIKAI